MPFAVLNDTGNEKEQKKDNNLPLSLLQERQAGLCYGASTSLMASEKVLTAPVIVSQQT